MKVVAELIIKHFPDWRRVLNECQRYSVGGEIDSGILASFSDISINDLTKNLKEKNFSEVRKWVNTNLDNDTTLLFRRIYDSLYETLVVSSIPATNNFTVITNQVYDLGYEDNYLLPMV